MQLLLDYSIKNIIKNFSLYCIIYRYLKKTFTEYTYTQKFIEKLSTVL